MPVEKTKEKKAEKVKKVTEAEYEKQVIALAKTGITSEKIGLELKKQEIHPGDFKKKISHILKEKDLYENPDLKHIEEKLEKVKAHYDKNKQDKRAMREKDRVFAQLRVAKKYHDSKKK